MQKIAKDNDIVDDPLDMAKYTKRGAYHWYSYRNDMQYKKSVVLTYELIHKLEPNKNISIIDFGCGDGLYTHLFARAKYNVVGIDKNPLAIELAKNIHLVQWHGVSHFGSPKFVVGEVKDIYPVDVILLFDVFEHLPKPDNVEKVLYKNCKRIYLLNPEWESEHHVKQYTTEDMNMIFSHRWTVEIIKTYYNKTLYRIEKK